MSYIAIIEARKDAESRMEILREALRLRQEKETARAAEKTASGSKPDHPET